MKKLKTNISFCLIVVFLFVSCSETDLNKDPVSKKPALNFQFIKVRAGEYILGDELSSVNPLHMVEIKDIYMSAYEITNEQFKKFTNATGYVTTAEKYKNAKTFRVGLDEFEWIEDSTANWRYPFGAEFGGIEDKIDYPVTTISYYDVQEFCKWAGVRLPTLDEWEIACRCGVRDKYFFGKDSALISEHANIWTNRTHKEITKEDKFLFHSPVGTFKPNRWGFYDMYGNNFEFCEGKFERIKDNNKLACARGGSWWCSKNSCNFFNSIDIGSVHKFASFSNHGFRVVKIEE